MSDLIHFTDFDLDLCEILLIHKNTFVRHFKWSEYRLGRGVDGYIYCLSGVARFDFGDDSFLLSAGESVFLPACSSYVVRCESSEPFIHYTFNFRLRYPYVPPVHTMFSDIVSGNIHFVRTSDIGGHSAALAEKLLSVWQAKSDGYLVMAKAHLYELLFLYFSDAGYMGQNRSDYEKILPARKFLDEHYMNNDSVAALAALCRLSETHFRRLFVHLIGVSPTEYRLGKRILRAKDLLLSGQYTVRETAHIVGFTDANYFSRVFHRRVGVTPTAVIMQSKDFNETV